MANGGRDVIIRCTHTWWVSWIFSKSSDAVLGFFEEKAPDRGWVDEMPLANNLCLYLAYGSSMWIGLAYSERGPDPKCVTCVNGFVAAAVEANAFAVL
jgi:hypothetical protein